MNLDAFQDFIKKNIVKKQTPNKERALSLIKEAEEKKKFLLLTLQKIPSEEMNANYVVDSCYDILMELTRAKMFLQGYNSNSSHEVEVSFLRVLGFSETDVRFMNELRYYRNGIKYYGTILNKEYAEKVLKFMEKMYTLLK